MMDRIKLNEETRVIIGMLYHGYQKSRSIGSRYDHELICMHATLVLKVILVGLKG
jgi:hypothetical protein